MDIIPDVDSIPFAPTPNPLVSENLRRLRMISFIALVGVLGYFSVRRIVNGNGDLSGNYAIWRANLSAPLQPGRHLEPGTGLNDPDPYLPITYALFSPLGLLPIEIVASVWYGMNLACTVFLYRELISLIKRSVISCADAPDPAEDNRVLCPAPDRLSQVPEKGHKASFTTRFSIALTRSLQTPDGILLLVALAIMPAWIGTVLIGQNTLLLMSLVLFANRLAETTWAKSFLAGSCLTLAIVLKVLPVVFLLPCLLKRQFRVLLGASVAGVLLFAGLGNLYFGTEKNWEFHQRWLQFVVSGPDNRTPDPRDPNTLRGSLRDKNQAIEAVMARLLMDIPIHHRSPDAPHVNFASVSPQTWRMTSNLLTITSVFLCLLTVLHYQSYGQARTDDFADQRIFRGTLTFSKHGVERHASNFRQLAILCTTQLLISPVLWSHYYVWLALPLSLLLLDGQSGRKSGYWVFAAWILALPCLGVELCRAIGLQLWLTILLQVWMSWPALGRLSANLFRFASVLRRT